MLRDCVRMLILRYRYPSFLTVRGEENISYSSHLTMTQRMYIKLSYRVKECVLGPSQFNIAREQSTVGYPMETQGIMIMASKR